MPFLRRQQSQPIDLATAYALHSPFTYKNPIASLSNASIKSQAAGLINRVSNIFSSRRKKRNNSSGLEQIASRFTRGRGHNAIARSPSPGSDLDDIRRPSGLGPASSDVSIRSFTVEIGEQLPSICSDTSGPILDRHTKRRLRSVSSPETPRLKLKKSRDWEALNAEPDPPLPRLTKTVALADLPWNVLLSFLPRQSVLNLALVSRHFSHVVARSFYDTLDLRSIDKCAVKNLLDVLSTRQHRSDLVRTFICHSWPASISSRVDPQTRHMTPPTSISNFAVALSNMHHLTTLTLPTFDADLLRRTDLRLLHLTFLNHRISQGEYSELYSWLYTQPDLLSLSFPNFMDGLPDARPAQNNHLLPSITDVSHTSGLSLSPALTIRSLPSLEKLSCTRLLPSLTQLTANPAVVMHLSHSRISHATVNIDSTLYSGLRPTALLNTLRSARHVALRFSENVDRRSLEKTLHVAGIILGEPLSGEAGYLLTLNVEVGDICERVNEVVYKAIGALISRSKALNSLRLCRISGRDSSLSRSVSSCSSRFVPPPKSSSSYPPANMSKPLPPPPPFQDVTPTSVQRSIEDRASELALLENWARQCPSLRNVTFLTKGEWAIERDCETADSPVTPM